jgi:hypothetical protein
MFPELSVTVDEEDVQQEIQQQQQHETQESCFSHSHTKPSQQQPVSFTSASVTLSSSALSSSLLLPSGYAARSVVSSQTASFSRARAFGSSVTGPPVQTVSDSSGMVFDNYELHSPRPKATLIKG